MLDINSDATFVQHATQKPSTNYVKFYRHFVEKFNEHRDYVLIISPGQSKTEVRRPAQELDKSTYAQEWTLYTQGKENQISGTPLEMMGLDKGLCDALKTLYVHTVEQAADLSDLAIQKIMGGHDIRTKAKAFMQKNSAEVVALQTQINHMKVEKEGEVAALRQMVERLENQLQSLSAAPKSERRKPGPKPGAKRKAKPRAKSKEAVNVPADNNSVGL